MKGIQKHGNGYRFKIYLGIGEDGKKKTKWSETYRTLKEAQIAKAKYIAERATGNYILPSNETLGDYMTRWLAEKQPNIEYDTYRKYEWLIRCHIIPRLGHIRLSKLQPQHLQNFYRELLAPEVSLSKRSVLHAHNLLHGALERAVKWGLIGRNIADLVEPPKPDDIQMSVWGEEDIAKFLQVAKEKRYYIAFVLAIATGMRKAEILGLHWNDIDFKKRTLSVKTTLKYVKGIPTFKGPKTPKSRRVITLDSYVVEELKKHKHRQLEEKLRLGPAYHDLDLVVAKENGEPVYPRTLDNQWYSAMEKAGVPRIRFHDLRHTHASLLGKLGVNPKVVSARLGHASVKITLDTYSHIFPSMEEQAAERFGEAVFGVDLKRGSN